MATAANVDVRSLDRPTASGPAETNASRPTCAVSASRLASRSAARPHSPRASMTGPLQGATPRTPDPGDHGDVGEPDDNRDPVASGDTDNRDPQAGRDTGDNRRRRVHGDRGRTAIVIPVLLAALGLVAAVIAWRTGVAGNIADDANRSGLDAARERAASVIINEGFTARATEAYLDYERSRQRAEALAAAGVNDDALLNRMQAAGHWFLVRSEYIDRNGQFQPNEQRAALLADDEQQKDIQPLAHFEAADSQSSHLRGLIGAGIVVALALPFLTLAEIGRGRLRIVSVLTGVGIFLAGLVLAVVAWL